MTIHIRPYSPGDAPSVVQIANEIDPDNRTSLSTFEARERSRKPDLLFTRLIAEQGGEVIGFGSFGQLEWFDNPRSLMLTVNLRPDLQGQGLGRTLYECLLAEVRPHDPERLLAFTAEDRPRALRFLEERGWTVIARERPSAVKLEDLDLSGLDQAVARLEAQGYQIRTFADLADDPEREAKYYALDVDASRDVPMPEGEAMNTPAPERYWQMIRANPHLDQSLWFVAVKDGEYGALSQLYHSDTPGVLTTGFTGTARTHRRRGLALALKLAALQRARDLGIREVRTENDATNAPMLAINDALGFRPLPAWLTYALELEQTPAARNALAGRA